MTEEERDYLQMYLDEIEGLPVCSDGQRTAYAMSVMAFPFILFFEFTSHGYG